MNRIKRKQMLRNTLLATITNWRKPDTIIADWFIAFIATQGCFTKWMINTKELLRT